MPCECQPKHPKPRKLKCCPGVEIDYIEIPVSAGTDEPGQPLAPENGAHKNAVVRYAANNHVYIYTSEGIPVMLSDGGDKAVLSVNGKTGEVVLKTSDLENDSDYQTSSDVETIVGEEVLARIDADNGLQQQIDAISASSDVTDIVGSYNDLERYDTSKLKDNDIIKVLQDETHDNETTYYRWDKDTGTFTLIGEEGPYYTKSAADQKFQNKLTAGTNITIDPLTDTISASADAETIFYANLSETGTSRHIYKEISFTTAVSAQEIIDANNEGQVILRGTTTVNPTAYSDAYLQNAFIMPHNNDFEFVFLDRDLRHEYTASDTADTAFYYYTSEIQPKLTAGANINISGTTISATDTTYSDMVGATTSAAGTHGLAPAPVAGSPERTLKSDGTWSLPIVNSMLRNLAVAADTPAGWLTAIESAIGKSVENESVTIYYNVEGKFAGQPSKYGFLKVNIQNESGTNPNITQIWFDQSANTVSFRDGIYTGWHDATFRHFITAGEANAITAGMFAAGAVMTGATSSTAGTQGTVPAPTTSEYPKFLRASGSWDWVQNLHNTTSNLSPSSDLPNAWATTIRADIGELTTDSARGTTITFYSQNNKFAAQPSQYGWLVTMIVGGNNDATVRQIWVGTDGRVLVRGANLNNAFPAWARLVDTASTSTVSTTMLADSSVTTAKINSEAVTRAKFGSGAEMVGATSSANGSRGVAPAPSAGEEGEFLRGDGTWASPPTASDSTYGQIKSSASTIKLITQADFTALTTKDPNTLYLVRENPSV